MDELLIRRITNLKASLQDIRNNLLNLQDIHKEIAVTESDVQANRKPNREELRVRIIIRDDMIRKLSELKESRC